MPSLVGGCRHFGDFAPSSCPFSSPLPRQSPALGWPSPVRWEEKAVEAHIPPFLPTVCSFHSVVIAAAPPPHHPCSFSQPQHQCPRELMGTEVCPLHWPRLPTPEHPGINGKQQDLSALPLSSGLWGLHSPWPSVPFHLSGQCCFLKPAILPLYPLLSRLHFFAPTLSLLISLLSQSYEISFS